MTLIKLPSIDPQTIRDRDGADLNEPLRRRPIGYRRIARGLDAQQEAELRGRGL